MRSKPLLQTTSPRKKLSVFLPFTTTISPFGINGSSQRSLPAAIVERRATPRSRRWEDILDIRTWKMSQKIFWIKGLPHRPGFLQSLRNMSWIIWLPVFNSQLGCLEEKCFTLVSQWNRMIAPPGLERWEQKVFWGLRAWRGVYKELTW